MIDFDIQYMYEFPDPLVQHNFFISWQMFIMFILDSSLYTCNQIYKKILKISELFVIAIKAISGVTLKTR